MVIHHIDFAVTDFARSRAFYVATLAPLGIEVVMDIERNDGRRLTGFGSPPDPTFWIRAGNGLVAGYMLRSWPIRAAQWMLFT
jgi:catechol 2,3-dioxygenase-like lactoylglutathione lyase family enzyme